MNIYQWGLVCNIVGTVWIAFWGFPNYFHPKGGGFYVTMHSNPEDKTSKGAKANRRRKVLAWVGISLLFIGFVLELADSFKHPH